MKQIVVVTNVEIMRAFEMNTDPGPCTGECPGPVAREITLPTDAAAKRRWQGLEWRIDEIAENLNRLIVEERADSWFIAAPLGLLVNVMPSLDGPVAGRLADLRIGDLTCLTPDEVNRVFHRHRYRAADGSKAGLRA